MNCPKCDTPNEEVARFCASCGAVLISSEDTMAPTTGPTTRFDQPVAELAPALSAALMAPRPAVSMPSGRLASMNGALWLIGLGVLFLMHAIWPGILILVGISSYLMDSARGNQQKGLRTLVFFVGLALLTWTNRFFPGILILLGICALLSPEIRRGQP